MPSETLTPLSQVQLFELRTREATIGIDLQTGSIRSVVWNSNQLDLFQQLRGGIPGYAGCLRIYDELEDRWYHDLKDEYVLRELATAENKLSFKKQYVGAPFELTVTYSIDQGFLRWQVEARKNKPGLPDRSLRVYFQTPLIAGWDLWAPCHQGERVFDGMTPFEHCHLQVSYVSESEVILPMFSTYSKAADVGYSILEPLDARVPAAKFAFNNADRGFTWRAAPKPFQAPVLETVNYYIGLVGDRPMQTEVMLFFHEGDWRPALGRVFERWRPYFEPKNPRIFEIEGMFSGGAAYWDRRSPERIAQTGARLFEVHTHFSYYSDYFQDGQDRWLNVMALEEAYRKMGGSKTTVEAVWAYIQTHRPEQLLALIEDRLPEDIRPEAAIERLFTTREFMKQYIVELERREVYPFWYFNYTDGFRPVVEKRWPDAICKNEDGSLMSSGWYMCHNMNADPQYSFGKFQIESAKKILAEYPKLAGFFLDCFRHFEVDFGHDDGVTVANNRAAYSVNFSYDPVEKEIEKMLLDRNMCTFANKPQTIRSMRWVDGMLLEGDGDQMEDKYFWASIAKPALYYFTSDRATDDESCRRALLMGCYPPAADAWNAEHPEKSPPLEQIPEFQRRGKYLPLCDQLRRRVLCFEPDPLRVPKGCRGRLFTVGENYVAAIVNLNFDEGVEVRHPKPLHAMFRVRRGHDVTQVGVMTPGQTEFEMVPFKFNGTFIAVPLTGFVAACVVKLFVTKKTSKSIGVGRFKGAVDSCGDPDSSFAETNNR
ncbi:MAG: hypothetical protein ACREJ2_12015 [Planctomycetota bacterium]